MNNTDQSQIESATFEAAKLDEPAVMRGLANRIAGNASPDQNSRLEVAYAIARHLELGWPSAQPAAAQEAVAFRLEVQSAGVEPFTQYVTDRAFIATLRNAGRQVRVTPLYAAAAPAAPGIDLGPGINVAAQLIQKKADDYAEQFGHDDMGGLSFGSGRHADVKSDHHSFMLELVDELRALIDASPKGGGDAVDDAMVERAWMAFTRLDKLGPEYADDAKCMTREERRDMRAALTAAMQANSAEVKP